MVEITRWLCAACLGAAVCSGCNSVAKHDNPVFGASPRRTSLNDAPDARAIAEAEDLEALGDEEVQLVGKTDEDDSEIFNATVVATANGAPVFASDVLERYGDYLRQARTKISQEDFVALRDEIIRRDLKSHIQKQLLVERTKGELKPEQVKQLHAQLDKMFEKRVEQLKKEMKVTTRTELERELNQRGTSLNEIRNNFISQGIAQGYLEARAERPKQISPQDMVEYYHAHADDYRILAKVRWRQVQVTFSNAGGKSQALEKLSAARAELENGVPFEKVVKKYSDGPTADEGGLRDWTQQGSLADEALDQLLFSLPAKGEPKDYIGPQSCQILQVMERTNAGLQPFSESIQNEIHKKLQESMPTNVRELVESIYDDAVIETKYNLDGPRGG